MSLKHVELLIKILIILGMIILLAPLRYVVIGEVTKLIDLNIAVLYIVFVIVINFLAKRIKTNDMDTFISREDSLLFKGIIFYVVMLILSCIVNVNVTDIMGTGLSILALLPFFVFIKLARIISIGPIFRKALFACTVIGIVICMYEALYLGNMRPCGLLGNANNWAGYLGFVLPISIYGVMFKAKKERALYIVLSVSIVVCLLYVRSRAMLLGLIELGALYAFFKAYKYNKTLFICLVCSLLFLIILNTDNIAKFLGRGYDNDRLQAYYAALNMFRDNFWFGVGYRQFCATYMTQYVPSIRVEFLPHAHSMYLQYLATTGLSGFIGLMVLFYCLVRSLYLRALKNSYYFVGIVGVIIFLLHGIFDSPISNTDFYRVFWLFVIIYNINIFEDIE